MGVGPVEALVALQDLGDLQADGQDRVQRRQRVLEDHADVAAATVTHAGRAEAEQVDAVEVDGTGDGVAACGQQTHDRQ